MAWAPGPQQLASVSVGGNSINADLIENYSSQTEGTSYDSAKGIPVERGFSTRTTTFDCLDYSQVSALETLMKNRTLSTEVHTYLDGATKTITSESIVRVTPLVNLVPDACTFYFETKDASQDWVDIAGTFTAAGVTMSDPTFDFSFPFDGVDGCGRPYFGGSVRADINFQLSGIRGATTDIYALFTFGENVDAAFAMPNGNFLAFKDMYVYVYYGPEDSTGVRTVDVHLRGIAADWSDMIFYTDGAAVSADADAWGTTTNSVDPGDTFAGCNVELVGTDYTEGGLITWA